MRIFMIGGTGLLGSEGAKELIARGHEVRSLALPGVPPGAALPPEMQLEFGNYIELTDDQIRAYMHGCDGFVFAAGIDERVEGPPPIYKLFKKYNITPLERLLRIAKECGVKHAVICGSYFAYFNRVWPALELAAHHPYIKSRVDQANMALSFAGDGFDVAVLELPYIFGTQPGRKPVWVFLVEMIQNMKNVTIWPKGGTTMVTVKQVGQCIAGALENNEGGKNYPVGWYNKTWRELLTVIHGYMGAPGKKIRTVPKWMYRLGMRGMVRAQKSNNIEGGLEMVAFTDVMCAETFIQKDIIEKELGVQPDDIDAAIGESVKLSLAILNGEQDIVDMKGE